MSAVQAQEIAQKLIDSLGLVGVVSIESEEPIFLNISTKDSALLIGKRGESLKALQGIINTIYRHNNPEFGFVGIDIEGYKKERVEKVQAIAQEMAQKAIDTGEDQHLKPMNSFERRSVHTLLSEDPNIVTDSEGEGLDRHIVIKKR
jgi:spoIIIJ-associated protein